VHPFKKSPYQRLTDESGPLGIAPNSSDQQGQSDVFKELVNKLSWALGSVYRLPYSSSRNDVRVKAVGLASMVLHHEGYPVNISK